MRVVFDRGEITGSVEVDQQDMCPVVCGPSTTHEGCMSVFLGGSCDRYDSTHFAPEAQQCTLYSCQAVLCFARAEGQPHSVYL